MPSRPTQARGVGIATSRRPQLLTRRHLDILRLVARGYLSKQIADELHLSRATVNEHIGVMRRRLAASTRAELVARAIHRGLLDPGRLWPNDRPMKHHES